LLHFERMTSLKYAVMPSGFPQISYKQSGTSMFGRAARQHAAPRIDAAFVEQCRPRVQVHPTAPIASAAFAGYLRC
jgi:hypothetical protein